MHLAAVLAWLLPLAVVQVARCQDGPNSYQDGGVPNWAQGPKYWLAGQRERPLKKDAGKPSPEIDLIPEDGALSLNGKRTKSNVNFTPRLGRESDRWLQEPPASSEFSGSRYPPFAPRLGRDGRPKGRFCSNFP